MIAIGTRRFAAAGTNIPPTLPTTALVVDGIYVISPRCAKPFATRTSS
jgi:hypothetical protein